MAKLIVKHPEKGEMTYPLSGERITVGRRADNQIQINHGTISGHHAEIVSVNGHYLLRDLDSTNHCFVDGFQVTEADLSDRCKLMIGTVECEYIPDEVAAPVVAAPAAPKQTAAAAARSTATPAELDNLRKTVGLLREQNEELVAKLNDQQKQVDILSNARLLTPAAGADIAGLREQVKKLTADRDRLQKENQLLKSEVEKLRAGTEVESLKATVPITLPGEQDTVAVGPGGSTVLAAPMAKVVAPDPVKEVAPQLVEFTSAAKTLLAKIQQDLPNAELRRNLARVTERMAERAAVIASHPVAQLIKSFDAVTHDVAQKAEPLPQQVADTLRSSIELLERLLAPELLTRGKALPAPRVLALSDESDLPAMVSALESARFQVTSCSEPAKALESAKDGDFDLVLLGTGVPGGTAEDCCAPLRALPRGSKLPVIALIPNGAAAPKGANDVLAKPVNMPDLTLRANGWVLRRQFELV